jgi:hypothetical protein
MYIPAIVQDGGFKFVIPLNLPRWWLHLIVVRRFEYASDPES